MSVSFQAFNSGVIFSEINFEKTSYVCFGTKLPLLTRFAIAYLFLSNVPFPRELLSDLVNKAKFPILFNLSDLMRRYRILFSSKFNSQYSSFNLDRKSVV